MVYVDLYNAIVAKVSNALFERDIVLLCAEIVGQKLPHHTVLS